MGSRQPIEQKAYRVVVHVTKVRHRDARSACTW
jgi:hypothetical protein